MSTDADFEQEWEKVKSELSKLEGQTIYTISEKQPNLVTAISEDGLWVETAKSEGPERVRWSEIKRQYKRLHQLGPMKGGRGAFCRAAFNMLTTTEQITQGRRTSVLRYVPEGRPPRLKG